MIEFSRFILRCFRQVPVVAGICRWAAILPSMAKQLKGKVCSGTSNSVTWPTDRIREIVGRPNLHEGTLNVQLSDAHIVTSHYTFAAGREQPRRGIVLWTLHAICWGGSDPSTNRSHKCEFPWIEGAWDYGRCSYSADLWVTWWRRSIRRGRK